MLLQSNPGTRSIPATVEGWEELLTGPATGLLGRTEDLALALALALGGGRGRAGKVTEDCAIRVQVPPSPQRWKEHTC